MHIALAGPADLDYLVAEDRHLPRGVLEQKVGRREILLLWVDEGLRGRGLGTGLISFWEEEMRGSGYEMIMTSSLSNERAQHLYRRLGYKDCGCLLMPEEPLEIMFSKRLT